MVQSRIQLVARELKIRGRKIVVSFQTFVDGERSEFLGVFTFKRSEWDALIVAAGSDEGWFRVETR